MTDPASFFVGLSFFLRQFIVALTAEKLELLNDWVKRVAARDIIEFKEAQSMIGFLNYGTIVAPAAGLYLARPYKFLFVEADCWCFKPGLAGLVHTWETPGQNWFVREVTAVRDLIFRSNGVNLLFEKEPPHSSEGKLELASDANRYHKNVHRYSGGGGLLKRPNGAVVTWAFEFDPEWVQELPIHILEAALLPVQEWLFLEDFKQFGYSTEWCDNACTVEACNRRRPSDVRLLTTVLLRDSLLELSADRVQFREVTHVGSKQNHIADSLSRGRTKEAHASLTLAGLTLEAHIELRLHPIWPLVTELFHNLMDLSAAMTDPSKSMNKFFGPG